MKKLTTLFVALLMIISVSGFSQTQKTEAQLLTYITDSLVVGNKIQSSKFLQFLKDINASKEDSTWIANYVTGIGYVITTANTTELNILDGALVSTTELNYSVGLTGNIQTQLNAKGDSLWTDSTFIKVADAETAVVYTKTQVDSLATVLRSEMGGGGITGADSAVYDEVNHTLIAYSGTVTDTFNTDGTGTSATWIDYISSWEMEEASSPNVDATGSWDFTGYSAPTYQATGHDGFGMQFPDGSASAIYYNSPSTINTALADEFTMSMWVKFDAIPSTTLQNQYLFRFMLTDNYAYVNTSDKLVFSVEATNITTATTTASVTTGTWYHIVVVANGDGQNGTIYVNGTGTNTSVAQSGNLSDLSSWFIVGNEYDDAPSEACAIIDEVKFWDRALTSTEVSSLNATEQ